MFFSVSPWPTELQSHPFSIQYSMNIAEAVLTKGAIPALGPLVEATPGMHPLVIIGAIIGAGLLPAAKAIQGMCVPLYHSVTDFYLCADEHPLHQSDTIVICFVDRSPSPQIAKYRHRERYYSRSPVESKSRSRSPYEEGYGGSTRRERSLSVSG